MSFAEPVWLLLAVPCVAFWWLLRRQQSRALDAIDEHISTRFRPTVTLHSRASIERHLALLLAIGLVLVLAGAGPEPSGGASDTSDGSRVLLLIDASASMYASDVPPLPSGSPVAEWSSDGEALPPTRLAHARALGLELVELLDTAEFAVASFSGQSTLQLPMTGRTDQVSAALRALDTHSHFRQTGSSLSSALEVVFHFVDPEHSNLQVVLIGDGELPFDEDYGPNLAALAAQDVAVHTVTLGTLEGQTRTIIDFRDVLAGIETPGVLRRFTTRRTDEHYKRIARSTGGRFEVHSETTAANLAEGLADRGGGSDAWRAVLPLLLLLALIGFVVESLFVGRRRARPHVAFDIARLGPSLGVGALLVATWVAGCGQSPIQQAHHANEQGIVEDDLRRFSAARYAFERSIGFDHQAQIPAYNLARTLTRAGTYSEAHEAYQRALTIDPDLAAAYFNDGIALYLWGRDERDPRDCDLERTQDLWLAARDRFQEVLERTDPADELAADAGDNRRAMLDRLAEIAELMANPPPHCLASSESGGEGGQREGAGAEEETGSDAERGGGAGELGDGDQDEPGESPAAQRDAQGGGSDDETEMPLSPQELEMIRQALERIGLQALEAGKFHRRTPMEQFPPSDWENPDPEIWW